VKNCSVPRHLNVHFARAETARGEAYPAVKPHWKTSKINYCYTDRAAIFHLAVVDNPLEDAFVTFIRGTRIGAGPQEVRPNLTLQLQAGRRNRLALGR
jgi:hypothetical protein